MLKEGSPMVYWILAWGLLNYTVAETSENKVSITLDGNLTGSIDTSHPNENIFSTDLSNSAQTLYNNQEIRVHSPITSGNNEGPQRVLYLESEMRDRPQSVIAAMTFPSYFQPQTPYHQDHYTQHMRSRAYPTQSIFGHNQHHQEIPSILTLTTQAYSGTDFRPSPLDPFLSSENDSQKNFFEPKSVNASPKHHDKNIHNRFVYTHTKDHTSDEQISGQIDLQSKLNSALKSTKEEASTNQDEVKATAAPSEIYRDLNQNHFRNFAKNSKDSHFLGHLYQNYLSNLANSNFRFRIPKVEVNPGSDRRPPLNLDIQNDVEQNIVTPISEHKGIQISRHNERNQDVPLNANGRGFSFRNNESPQYFILPIQQEVPFQRNPQYLYENEQFSGQRGIENYPIDTNDQIPRRNPKTTFQSFEVQSPDVYKFSALRSLPSKPTSNISDGIPPTHTRSQVSGKFRDNESNRLVEKNSKQLLLSHQRQGFRKKPETTTSSTPAHLRLEDDISSEPREPIHEYYYDIEQDPFIQPIVPPVGPDDPNPIRPPATEFYTPLKRVQSIGTTDTFLGTPRAPPRPRISGIPQFYPFTFPDSPKLHNFLHQLTSTEPKSSPPLSPKQLELKSFTNIQETELIPVPLGFTQTEPKLKPKIEVTPMTSFKKKESKLKPTKKLLRTGRPLYAHGKMLSKDGGLYATFQVLPQHHMYGVTVNSQFTPISKIRTTSSKRKIVTVPENFKFQRTINRSGSPKSKNQKQVLNQLVSKPNFDESQVARSRSNRRRRPERLRKTKIGSTVTDLKQTYDIVTTPIEQLPIPAAFLQPKVSLHVAVSDTSLLKIDERPMKNRTDSNVVRKIHGIRRIVPRLQSTRPKTNPKTENVNNEQTISVNSTATSKVLIKKIIPRLNLLPIASSTEPSITYETQFPIKFSSRYRNTSKVTAGLTVSSEEKVETPRIAQAQRPFASKPRIIVKKKFIDNMPKSNNRSTEAITIPPNVFLSAKDVLINRKAARRIPPGSPSERLKILHRLNSQELSLDTHAQSSDESPFQTKRAIQSSHHSSVSKNGVNSIQIFPEIKNETNKGSTETESEEMIVILGIPKVIVGDGPTNSSHIIKNENHWPLEDNVKYDIDQGNQFQERKIVPISDGFLSIPIVSKNNRT